MSQSSGVLHFRVMSADQTKDGGRGERPSISSRPAEDAPRQSSGSYLGVQQSRSSNSKQAREEESKQSRHRVRCTEPNVSGGKGPNSSSTEVWTHPDSVRNIKREPWLLIPSAQPARAVVSPESRTPPPCPQTPRLGLWSKEGKKKRARPKSLMPSGTIVPGMFVGHQAPGKTRPRHHLLKISTQW